jgi:FtsH-binding integral membrane protein
MSNHITSPIIEDIKSMFDQTNSVWTRTKAPDHELISARLYNIIIGLTLLWGFGLNYLIIDNLDPQWVMGINYWVLIIGYMVCSFAGIMLYTSSDVPIVSFIGYNLVVVPIGVLITPLIAGTDGQIVHQAITITGTITLTMMMLGAAYPDFFLKMGRVLFLSLILVIFFELGSLFLGYRTPGIVDWIVAVIFCGYIGYDWARANQIPYTVDNAIDSAASLYLDIINLFLRILRILSRR